ncbi:hypothetical protein [Streptosporangium sp. NPDC051022]|uniref:hypothetical protein n=1 Tax=Streptosporangium sp. NPDC051022 TaxID=3155752 RepID=UPI00342D3165
MPEYDPSQWPSYGAYLRDKHIQTRPEGWTYATHDQRTQGQRDDGVRWQRTRDQLGHDTTEHFDGRRDVRINLGLRGADGSQ